MKEIHLICNAHLDPIWQWTEDEGMFAAISTFRSAVNLCKEFDYIFCHNEAILYKCIKKYAPDLFEEIIEMHKQGKWHIMGGWYLQPDCNMPSGESFVRQILYGKQFFEENFNAFPETAINFDPFGHTKGLVQIISKCGQNSYIITRPEEDKLHLDSSVFYWEGFNGSRIKVNRAYGYNSPLGNAVESIKEKASKQPDDNVICVLWGVGNHGGGPSRKDLNDIENLIKSSDVRYIHSTPEQFFSQVEPTYTFKESLRISMPGCYTSMSRLKRKHIELENMLYFTEKLCSVASLKNLMPYPTDLLDCATEDLLACEFHDVLPGTSIMSGEENGIMRINHAEKILTDIRSQAFFSLSREFSAAKEGTYPILVFNSQPYELKTNVCCEFSLADQNWSDELRSVIKVYDKKGSLLPSQVIKEASTLNLDWRKKVIFEATLDPLCLTEFNIEISFAKSADKRINSDLVYSDTEKTVKINPDTGLVSSINFFGTEFLSGEITPELYIDNADPWGMGCEQQKQMGSKPSAFHLIDRPDGLFRNMNSVQIIENGEICRTVEAFFENGNNRLRLQYCIYKRQPYFDIHADVFFNDSDRMLKLKIPTAISGRYVGQTAFGTEPLFMDARECVSQRFVSIENDKESFTILNNCIYGSSYSDNCIYLSLLRGAGYCAHPIGERKLLPDNRFIKRMDQGWLSYDFRITVSDNSERTRLAQEFNVPPYALNVFPDSLKTAVPFEITLTNKNITIETFKKSNRSNDYIFHLFNGTPDISDTVLTVGKISNSFRFNPYEIKCIKLNESELIETELMII